MGLSVITQLFSKAKKRRRATLLSFNVFFLLSREPERISAQTLYCQKLDFLPKIYTAFSICLSLLVFTQLFFESRTVGATQTGTKKEYNAK